MQQVCRWGMEILSKGSDYPRHPPDKCLWPQDKGDLKSQGTREAAHTVHIYIRNVNVCLSAGVPAWLFANICKVSSSVNRVSSQPPIGLHQILLRAIVSGLVRHREHNILRFMRPVSVWTASAPSANRDASVQQLTESDHEQQNLNDRWFLKLMASQIHTRRIELWDTLSCLLLQWVSRYRFWSPSVDLDISTIPAGKRRST